MRGQQMARATITSRPERRPAYEPLYEVDPHTGACIEVFYADGVLAKSFGLRGTGWCWWTCQAGCLPGPVAGPFGSSYGAYGDALARDGKPTPFGKRIIML